MRSASQMQAHLQNLSNDLQLSEYVATAKVTALQNNSSFTVLPLFTFSLSAIFIIFIVYRYAWFAMVVTEPAWLKTMIVEMHEWKDAGMNIKSSNIM